VKTRSHSPRIGRRKSIRVRKKKVGGKNPTKLAAARMRRKRK